MSEFIRLDEIENKWRQQALKEYKRGTQNPTKIYLASPYTHENPNVVERRFILISFLTAYFTEQGFCVYSPILNGHIMTKYANLPGDYSFWAARDQQFICWADEFRQVRLEGWENSIGMARELTQARLLNKQIKFVELFTGISEREFSMECLFWKTKGDFSEKVELNIQVKEMG